MQIGYKGIPLLSLLWVSHALHAFSLQKTIPAQVNGLSITTTLFGADPGIDLSTTPDSLDLSKVGSDIDILPPQNGVKRVVMKFGGSSIANAERVTYVAKLIKKHVDKGYQPILVCSAMGKTTNSLLSSGESALNGEINTGALRNLHISTAKTLGLPSTTICDLEDLLSDVEKLLNGIKYIGELSPRTRDTLVSFGERMSVRVMAATLVKLGVESKAFDAWSLGLKTNSEFGNADIKDESYDAIRVNLDKLDMNSVPVITGFIGHDDKGRITTLGRGGSDLTATFFGSAVGVDEIQVWKV
jgi:aspartate kinase